MILVVKYRGISTGPISNNIFLFVNHILLKQISHFKCNYLNCY